MLALALLEFRGAASSEASEKFMVAEHRRSPAPRFNIIPVFLRQMTAKVHTNVCFGPSIDFDLADVTCRIGKRDA